MRQWTGFLAIGLLVGLAVINVAVAQEGLELGRIFDRYNAEAKAGDVNKMLSLRTTESQKEIRSQIAKKEDRDYFQLISRAQVPESYQIQHVSRAKSGKSATLYLLGQYAAMPEIQRPRTRMEVSVTFKKKTARGKSTRLSL
jgi:hypothetical protein